MADNQYSRRHASRIEDLPENDPLAELARIVGFDSQPAPSGPKSDIDLENELLRELGVFDEPTRSEPSRAPEEPASIAERPPAALLDDEHRFADGSVEISLEDELLLDIEDGYRADDVADVQDESEIAPVVAEDFHAVEIRDASGVTTANEGDRYSEPPVDNVPEPPAGFFEPADESDGAPAWEEESAEEFDALARHEIPDESRDERPEAAFDSEAYPVGRSEETPVFDQDTDEITEQWDYTPAASMDVDERREIADDNPLDEVPAEAFVGEQPEAFERPEPGSADENGEDNDLPFIALSHPEEEPEQHADIGPIDIAGFDSELAAGFDPETMAQQPASEGEYQQSESSSEEEFHPHNLFDPAPEAWQEVDIVPQDEPIVASGSAEFAADADSETEAASAEFSGIIAHQASETPLAPPPSYAHSAEDVLAEIERFDLVKRDEEPVLTGPQQPVVPEQPIEAASEHEDAAPDLDDWLREMTLDQPGERDEAPANEVAGIDGENVEPEYYNGEDIESEHQDNVVQLHPASPEPTEPPLVDEPVSDVVEDDFISDDMIDLDAALEADLAAVHEEILSEAEIGRAGEPNEVVVTGADEGERDEVDSEPEFQPEAKPESEGFFFPPVEPPSQAAYEEQEAAEHPAEAEADYSSPANLEAVASLDANTSNDYEFDAASLAEPDEPVEPMADLGIPDISREAEETPAALVDDEFDLDMEAEFAELLDNGHAEPESTAESAEDDHTTGMAAAAVAGGAAAAAGLGYSQRQQEAAVEPSHVSFDYDDMERSLDVRVSDELTEGPPAANPFDDERPSVLPAAATSTTFFNRRRMVLAGGVAGLVVLAGVGILAWNYGGADGQGSSAPPIIAADSKPAKEKPADPGGKAVPNQNKVVYDSVDGTMSQKPEQQKLVTTSEQPVDVVQRTLDPDVLPLGQQRANMSAANGAAPQSVEAPKGQDRLAAESGSAGAPQDAAPRGVEPHRVQTMIVTADGKLVPREESQPAPAAGTDDASSNAVTEPAQVQPQPMSPPAPAAPAPHPSPRPTDISAAAPAAPAPTSPAPTAPTPAAAAPAANEPAAETAKAAPAEQTQPVDNPGGYFIQISSQPSEAAANASYKNLSTRYSSVIGGRGVDIQRAEIDGKGVYYRVRIPGGTREEAISLCESYKGAGGSCYVTR